MAKKIATPIIYKTRYSRKNATELDKSIESSIKDESKQDLLINYPTVYIINKSDNKNKVNYTVYVGETNDIQRRTFQHLDSDPQSRSDWKKLSETKDALMYVIGHEHFNKSLTLDIENRMMQYLSGVNVVSHLNNRRENAQNEYYTSEEMPIIFDKIWRKLHNYMPDLFPVQRLVEESALFKASPFHKLTRNQLRAKDKVLDIVNRALASHKTNQLVLVEGEAGAGKTVLMSNIFYDLAQEDKRIAMMVNHPQQEKVYKQIAEKLNMGSNAKVVKAATFIKKQLPNDPIDIAFIDEAHLLLTQRSQAYSKHGTNELLDIIKRARVTIAVYDKHQILQSTKL